ncbi:hypothetical protein ACWENS_05475 [Streptomyces sp. NPDC004532]
MAAEIEDAELRELAYAPGTVAARLAATLSACGWDIVPAADPNGPHAPA